MANEVETNQSSVSSSAHKQASNNPSNYNSLVYLFTVNTMMMMMKIASYFFLVFPAVAFPAAFVTRLPPRSAWTTTTRTTVGSSRVASWVLNSRNKSDDDDDDSALARLQHEYKVLQERLYRDLVIQHDEEDAEQVEEQMIGVLTDATKILEHKQMEIIDEADRTRSEAQKARQRARSFQQNERADGEMEAAYEDLVRYSDYKELQAADKKEAAQILLNELKENEERLGATLEKLRTEAKKNTAALEEELHTQHRSFLDDVKGAIYAHPDILIGLDPHIL